MKNVSSKALTQDQIIIPKKGWKFAPTDTGDIAEEVIAQVEGLLPATKEYKDDDEEKKKWKEDEINRKEQIRSTLQRILLKSMKFPKHNITIGERRALQELHEE